MMWCERYLTGYTARMKLFDAHCHLQFPQYTGDLPEVLARMREADMGAVIIGTDYATSQAGLALANQHDFLWAAVGLHPNDNLDEAFDAAAYEALARDPKVVAIGECGLDYYRTEESEENKRKQQERFLAHIELAKKVGKPLIIHCRDSQQRIANVKSAHDDCSRILENTRIHAQVPVIIHFCTVSGEIAQHYLNLGCYLSFPGPVTFTDMYDESIRLCPMDRLLIETDAPFAAPAPYRGRRNEPAYVIEVAKKVAVLKGVTAEEVAAQAVANASSIFTL